ncbi:acyltransferase domain-containing protein [Streptomyces sp. SB3404]|uniref:Acyltransferase domain-containing protein n=1 Tax=Streptomyces boncukensis TaxID=2711219 RepID=A0A6G4WRH7_9ACTN|nr:type I polyketide synthase [Streptomyces boncukensis]NGO67240.1 acyltransferase domain-containing protein [Streptomyces boncukensis]
MDNEKLLGYLKRASVDLHEANERIRELEAGAREPIAITGMACRLPGGVSTPEQLFDLVAAGRDAVAALPGDRQWGDLFDPDPDAPGKTYVREGGFLYDAADFDAAFFDVSPREALAIDPQQRLLLELTWEAFERAGIAPPAVRGSRTGVFAGVMYNDYASRLRAVPPEAEGHIGTASAGSVASGRVAYAFGLRGPAVSVDTACSSSLVALHLASQALRQGDCTMALAGGVALMAAPGPLIEYSRQRGLARDGRCKAFADSADGTSLAEGAAMLLLERLSDAERNGHPVLAVIRGSAVNQDGASNGLTAPNGPSQESVIRQALENARLEPTDVDLVEAHGTGTALGDPIEAQALLATYGRDRDEPLWLGSLKSNIGHTQAAAGAAGLIKTVMSMRHGVLPRTLHVRQPTTQVDWTAGRVELLTEQRAWPDTGRARRAAVSSFGVSGTNAHVILEHRAAPETAARTPAPDGAATDGAAPEQAVPEDDPVPWVLSAKSQPALREQAARLLPVAGTHPAADIGHSLASGRALFKHRAVVVGRNPEEFRSGLRAIASGDLADHADHAVTGTARGGPVCFVFPGQGSEWLGMATELIDQSPVFARRMAECAGAVEPLVNWKLTDALHDPALLERIDMLQPTRWAVMVSLAAVWESRGVSPSAVVGTSQGEVAAASVAGALTLEEGARVVVVRSRLLAERIAGHGSTASAALSKEEAEDRLRDHPGVSIAGVNGPRSVLVSGDTDGVRAFVDACTAGGVRSQVVVSNVSSHCSQMDQLHDDLLAGLGPLRPAATDVALYSSVRAAEVDGRELDAHYWFANLRRPILLHDTVGAMLDAGIGVFIEVSPHPVLTAGIQECAEDRGADASVVPTLRRDEGGLRRLRLSLGRAWACGAPVTWPFPGARHVGLPTYPFQRTAYWLADTGAPEHHPGAGLDSSGHPLLPAAVDLGPDGCLLTGSLGPTGWLADHMVAGHTVVPGTALVEMAVAAGRRAGTGRLAELTIPVPMVLPESGATAVSVRVGSADDSGARPVTISSRAAGSDAWTLHAEGLLADEAQEDGDSLAAWPPAGARPIDITGMYERMSGAGVHYGPAFRGLRSAWRHGDDILAEVALPDEDPVDGFASHPALLDAALHALAVDRTDVQLPFTWSDVAVHRPAGHRARVRIRGAGADTASVLVADHTGQPAVTVGSLVTRPPAPDSLSPRAHTRDALYRVLWKPVTGTAAHTPVAPVRPGSVSEALRLVQAHLTSDDTTELVVLTSEETAGVRGLLRAAQSEHPGRFQLVDCAEQDEDLLPSAVSVGEPEVAIRGGVPHVRRLARVLEAGQRQPGFDPDGTVLITGGTGVLGGLVARHLVARHGVRHLLLVGRGGRADVADIEADVSVAACDVSDRDEVRRTLAGIPDDHPLTAVFHLAGALADTVVESLTPEDLTTALRPKADAAWILHELTREVPLSAFVLFSSAAGVLGGPGQANYAAANTALDALAAHRRETGLPAQSLAWGLWEPPTGMNEHVTAEGRAQIGRTGVDALSVSEGLALLDWSLALDEPLLVPIRLNTAAMRGLPAPPLFEDILGGRRSERAAAPDQQWRERLGAAPESDRGRLAGELVAATAAAVLGYDRSAELPADKDFLELGFDSLTAIEFRNRINDATGLRLPAGAIFQHRTREALADAILARIRPAAHTAAPADTLLSLFQNACETGEINGMLAVLREASRYRPAFGDLDDLGEIGPLPGAERLGPPADGLRAVCLPSVIAPAGSYQYARFAAALRGRMDVRVQPHPGYAEPEPLPATREAAVRAQAQAVRNAAGDGPFVVVGYSAGGWVAHAVARELARTGPVPLALVLIDTYVPGNPIGGALLNAMVRGLYLTPDSATDGLLTGTQLTAMGGYIRLFDGWEPGNLDVPTLFVRPEECVPGGVADPSDEWRAVWELPHRDITAQGDHFSMMEKHVESTANAVYECLMSLLGGMGEER